MNFICLESDSRRTFFVIIISKGGDYMLKSKIESILDKNSVQDSENLANALAEILSPENLSEIIDTYKTRMNRLRGDI